MRYLPKSPAEREKMLAEIGAGSMDELFAVIPAECRLAGDLDVPRQQAESEIIDYFKAAGAKNATGYASFLGAGAYHHYRPVIIDSLVQRGEFLTSYTPYQAEITQGTLQAIFEFQTMIAELTGMDVANASMYDGSTGAAEAVRMAMRVTGREKSLVARTVHPEYREVMATYARHQGLPSWLVGYEAETGRVDLAALKAAVTDETAAVLVRRVLGGKPVAIVLGSLGFASTFVTLILALVPSADEPNKPLAVTKVVGGMIVLVGAGVVVFIGAILKARREAKLAPAN